MSSRAQTSFRGTLRFGAYEADPRSGELRKHGLGIALEEKPFQALVILLQHANEVVTRDELRTQLWPTDIFIDFDNSLNTVIAKARRALNDSAENPRFIETVGRRGYRFIAAVESSTPDDNQRAHTAASAAPSSASVVVLDSRAASERPHGQDPASSETAKPQIHRRGVGYAFVITGAALVATVVLLVGLDVGGLRGRFLGRSPTAPEPVRSYQQLTNVIDTALVPSFSPDGRMLTFIRGTSSFGESFRQGQVFVKMLPGGEPVQLTHDDLGKETPTFSPDGSRIVYTAIGKGFTWDTWEVPVLGGEPRLMLPNASGLTWIGNNQLLFSEIKQGVQMGIVTATESRGDERSIYLPPGQGMAHRSALSPDRKWVLVVEMDASAWRPCRLVPFDGSSTGHAVGPSGACTYAAWSADGRWMYFTASVDGFFHVWRQAFPDGQPEQITFGPAEEESFALAPDGRSMIVAAGMRQGSVWIHDAGGDRRISSQSYAFLPSLSPDGSTLYYLVRNGALRSYVSGELWAANLATGAQERLLPGLVLSHYALSSDGKQVLFARAEGESGSGLWLANLDRRSPPRQITSSGEYRGFFGAPGEIVFQSNTDPRHLFRMNEDGSGRRQISPDPILMILSVSHDGRWLIASSPTGHGEQTSLIKAYPLHGETSPIVLCDICVAGFGPGRIGAPPMSWGWDGNFLYLALKYFSMHSRKTVAIPLKSPMPYYNLTNGKLRSDHDFAQIRGARLIDELDVFPGPNTSFYAFSRKTAQTNLYRIELRR